MTKHAAIKLIQCYVRCDKETSSKMLEAKHNGYIFNGNTYIVLCVSSDTLEIYESGLLFCRVNAKNEVSYCRETK